MDLFDVIKQSEEEEKPIEKCSHSEEEKTLTIWPGETSERLTYTCKRCKKIRGRVK